MKARYLILAPIVSALYCLAAFISNQAGFGPLDYFARASRTVECENGIRADVYRQKDITLITTEHRVRIENGNLLVIDDALYGTDFWFDIGPEDLHLVCDQNEIQVSAKPWFDVSYRVSNIDDLVRIKQRQE